jgi:hypothetical protein
MLDLLRPYADRGWVEVDAAGLVISVTMPEVAVALLPSLGQQVASYRGTGPALAAGWARWFPGAAPDHRRRRTPGGHALLARDGLLLDNGNRDLPRSATAIGASRMGGLRHRRTERPYRND